MATLAVGRILAFTKESPAKAAIEQRDGVGERSRLYSGRGLCRFKRAAFKLLGACRLIVQRAHVERQHCKIVRVKACIHLMGVAQAEKEESSAHQRNQADRYLQRDKNVTDVEARSLA